MASDDHHGYRRSTSASARLIAFALAIGFFGVGPARSQELPDRPSIDEMIEPEISREGWRERILEARRRAKDVAIERRVDPQRYSVIPEDPERVATERVLNDDSLRRGDIVSTKNGLFVFRGRSNQPRREDDFIALPAR